MQTSKDLMFILDRIDSKGYKAYKDIVGKYKFDDFVLFCDHIQADPFAPPSSIRVRVPQEKACIPKQLFDSKIKRIALEDYFTRQLSFAIKEVSKEKKGTGKSGLIECINFGQEIIERTSIVINDEYIEARLGMGMPARGRKIVAREAQQMLFNDIPQIIEKALIFNNINTNKAKEQVDLAVDQEYIRQKIKEKNLVCFVATDSILPRESGVSDKPLRKGNIEKFKSPKHLEVSFELPSGKQISGMGISKGVTMITGGGYHGKTTLLKAIERGVYDHIPGDGREYIITNDDAVKIRAEDGRYVEKVDISSFINNLPNGMDTTQFSTENASGSTSQAANIIEAIEAETSLLLLDEDTCATNFMTRDEKIQKLIAKENEPITPFVDLIRQLYEQKDISTIVVIGGCGDYFDVVDRVIMMKDYFPHEVTEEARKIVEESNVSRLSETTNQTININNRVPIQNAFQYRDRRKNKIKANGTESIISNYSEIDLRSVEQLVDKNQTSAIALLLRYMSDKLMDGKKSLFEIVNNVYEEINKNGLDIISPFHPQHPGNLALPRKQEVFAAVNRHRKLKIK